MRLRKYVNVKGKKADAERQLRELLGSLDRGIPINIEKVTVGDWVDGWLKEHVIPNRRQRTAERYRDIVRKHIKPYIGHVQLSRLTPTDIKSLESEWGNRGMSATGVTYAHRILSAALKYAVKMEVLYRNPVQVVDPPRVEKREVQPPDVGTVNGILTALEKEGDRFFPALRLIAYSGIRRGECLGLHWQQVDFTRQEITIVKSLVRSADKGLILEPPKSRASRRVIDLDGGTMEVLREHKVRQMEHRLLLGQNYADHDLVFPDEFGRPLNPMALTRALNRATKRVGTDGIKLHDLRHFHASLLLQSGQNPVLVSKRLGHSAVSMTLDIYGHLMPGWQKEAAEVFAKAMSQGS
jgi:integrase